LERNIEKYGRIGSKGAINPSYSSSVSFAFFLLSTDIPLKSAQSANHRILNYPCGIGNWDWSEEPKA
jgi:hypothetical protein